jgi:polar amino acid transport system substrate-binding protein
MGMAIRQTRTAVQALRQMCAQGMLLLCLTALNCVTAQAAPQVLVIATNEAPPYISENPQNSFLTDLLGHVAREMGVAFEFRFMPWPRCELAVDNLQVWATMPYVPTPERNSKFLFSQSLFAKQTLLFYYNPNGAHFPKTFQRLSELKPYRMGGVRSYFYEALFAQAGLSLDLANTEELSFLKLRAGRVDMVPAVDNTGWDIIRKNFPVQEQADFHTLETPLAVGNNYLMTSPRYPEAQALMERFNDALAEVRREGIYKDVAQQHGLIVQD